MKYDKFEALLQDQLDRRQPLELTEEMRAAVAADPECLRLYRAHLAWSSQLPRLHAPQPPEDLASRVLLELQAPSATTAGDFDEVFAAGEPVPATVAPATVIPRRRARVWLVWTATAASVAILAVAISTRWRQPNPAVPEPGNLAIQPGPANQPSPGSVPTPQNPLSPDASPAGSFVDVRQLAQAQYQALAQETRASWSDLSVLMPQYPVEVVAEVDVELANLPPTDGHVEPGAEPSSAELQPFEQSTRGAVGLLMRFAP